MSYSDKPEFEAYVPSTWPEFFNQVYAIHRFTGKDLDEICLQAYTEAVKEKLGEIPTPPWRLKASNG